jgi:hypothetical protein
LQGLSKGLSMEGEGKKWTWFCRVGSRKTSYSHPARTQKYILGNFRVDMTVDSGIADAVKG